MTEVFAVLGFGWSVLAWTVRAIADLTPLPVWLVWGGAGLWLYGHFERPVEFFVRRCRMRLNGYARYSDYIGGPDWSARRARFWREHGQDAACVVCAKVRRPGPRSGFHVHHVDRLRAGGGNEWARDLVAVCTDCHSLVHRVDRHLYAWFGVTLRANTWLVRHAALPVRLARRAARESVGV